MSSQKSVSLPSSPHDFGSETPEGSKASDLRVHEEMVSTWNRILESSVFQNKSLLPFEEWNINFSELTVGSRVGLGKPYPFSSVAPTSVTIKIARLALIIVLVFAG